MGKVASYILAVTKDVISLQRHRPLLVASIEAPEMVCGIARRIGSVGTQPHDPIVYRLWIKRAAQSRQMLPVLFVLDQGIFLEYEQWKEKLKKEEQDTLSCA